MPKQLILRPAADDDLARAVVADDLGSGPQSLTYLAGGPVRVGVIDWADGQQTITPAIAPTRLTPSSIANVSRPGATNARAGDVVEITPATFAGRPTPTATYRLEVDTDTVLDVTDSMVPVDGKLRYTVPALVEGGMLRFSDEAESIAGALSHVLTTFPLVTAELSVDRPPMVAGATEGRSIGEMFDLGDYSSSAGEVTVSAVYKVGTTTVTATTVPAAGAVVSVTITVTDDAGSDPITRVLSATVTATVAVVSVGGELAVDMPDGSTQPVTITSEPWAARGTWPVQVSAAALAAGPLNLVKPRLVGTPAVGETLAVEGGLWGYDAAGQMPSVTAQVQRDGVDVIGATGASYVIAEADQGKTLTVIERAVTQAGLVTAVSAGIAVPAAPVTSGFSDTFERADGLLIDSPTWTTVNGNPLRLIGGNVRQPVENAGLTSAARCNAVCPQNIRVWGIIGTKPTAGTMSLFGRIQGDSLSKSFQLSWRSNNSFTIRYSAGSSYVALLLASATATVKAGDRIEFEITSVGDVHTLAGKINGVSLVSGSYTSAVLTPAGQAGLGFTDGNDTGVWESFGIEEI